MGAIKKALALLKTLYIKLHLEVELSIGKRR